MGIILSTHSPARSYSGHILVAYIFSDSRPPKGMAGYVDWIMDGLVSDLIIKGKTGGRFCESLLMATAPKTTFPIALIIGAGEPQELNRQGIISIGSYTARVLNGLKVFNLGLYPHTLFLPSMDRFTVMDDLIEGFQTPPSDDRRVVILSTTQEEVDIVDCWLKTKKERGVLVQSACFEKAP